MMKSHEMQRRDFLKLSTVTGLAAMAGLSGRTWGADTGSSLAELSAAAAVDAMRRGDITAEAYATALLDRADRFRSLNAFISLDRDATLAAARAADVRRASGSRLGPLHGLPLPVKDSVNTKDLPTTSGTRALRSFIPKEDAPVMARLYGAGAILMGKTNLHELSYGWTSNNMFTGAVRNPYDPKRIPGGSSGGSGAAVAARIAPLAVAEDTFGSIRVPASMCGVCGLRPSTGRYPVGGVMPISPRMDMVGPLARSVSDLALFDAAISGESPTLSPRSLDGVRIGVAPGYFLASLDPEVERVFSAALRRLSAAGAVLVWADLPAVMDAAMLDGVIVQAEDTSPSITRYLEESRSGITFDALHAQLSADVKGTFDVWTLPGAQYHPTQEAIETAIGRLPAFRQAMQDHFHANRVEAIVFPPVPVPPLPIGQDTEVEIRGSKRPLWMAMSHNIAPASCVGMPGLVLPAGLTKDGLPVGVEFDALPGSDRQLLSLGLSLERALGPIPAPRAAG